MERIKQELRKASVKGVTQVFIIAFIGFMMGSLFTMYVTLKHIDYILSIMH